MTEQQQKHDADQAGGEKEIVYSSDGVSDHPALTKISFPPKVALGSIESAVGGGGGGVDIIDTQSMTAEQAFEVFSGKFFSIRSSKTSAVGTGSSMTTTESPFQRLNRLQLELNELQETVDTGSAEAPSENDAENLAFQNQVKSLRDQWNLLSEAHSRQKERLSVAIDTSVEGLNKPIGTVVASDGGTAVATSRQPDAALDGRLKRLEMALGAASFSSGNNKSIFDRLQKLENMQTKLDEKQLEQLQKRAKVIRQDLEAAAKARNKLMTSSTGGGVSSSEDSKIISALYDQLQSLGGISDHLPVLTQRLQLLAQQHTSAASWDTRLRSAERLTSTLESQLLGIENAISKLDLSLQQNSKQMQENINNLEQRMEQQLK